jgi:ankyrin repeat protein
MSHSSRSAAPRKLPDKPNLNQLKKLAKDLLKAFHAGQATAVAEVRAALSRVPPKETFQLSDAQLVLARAYGYESWPKLKAFVDVVTISRFVAAVKEGDEKNVRAMLRQRPELVSMDTSEGDEHRGLHHAVLQRNGAMVRMLMEAGADARKGIWPHRDATTAYNLARDRGFQEIVAIIEDEEQQRRAGMSCPNSKVTREQEEINNAIRKGDGATAMRILQAHPPLLKACDRDGGTPLHVAAELGDSELVTWLLQLGASVKKKDLKGRTPLDRAALSADPRDETAARFPAVARILIERGAELTFSAAIGLGNTAVVRQMAENDPSLLKRDLERPLAGPLTLAVKHRQPEIVRALLDLGADPDERHLLEAVEEPVESWGEPLWYAAFFGYREIAGLLLDSGADPNANVYASGWPLRNAYVRRDEAMKKLLIDRGARPQPYMVAEAHDVAEAKRLLEADGSEELANELAWSAADKGCPAIVELALRRLHWPADDRRWYWILIQPFRGVDDTMSMKSDVTIEDRLACLAHVLRHGANPNVPRMGQTVMHFLAARGGVKNESDRVRFAELLIDGGARLDLRDDLLKSTPLGWACRWGREELADCLLKRGSPAHEPDAEPWATPLSWATKMGHSQIAEKLRGLGAARD